MTPKQHFRDLMRERRQFQRGDAEWTWRTRAARTYLLMMRGVPARDWPRN